MSVVNEETFLTRLTQKQQQHQQQNNNNNNNNNKYSPGSGLECHFEVSDFFLWVIRLENASYLHHSIQVTIPPIICIC